MVSCESLCVQHPKQDQSQVATDQSYPPGAGNYFFGSYCFDIPGFEKVVKKHLFPALPDLELNVGQLD